MIRFDYSTAKKYVSEHEVKVFEDVTTKAASTVENGTGLGSDFLGWVNLPENYDKEEFDRIKKAAKQIRSNSDVLVVVGIGGSYLGAKAAIVMLTNKFDNFDNKCSTKIIYAGNSISSTYHAQLIEYLKDKDFSVNIIAKSGTTTEPALAFR